jgi:hypothetical protein
MTTTSPIDLALNAVYELFSKPPKEQSNSDPDKPSSTPPKLKAYTDDSSSKLEELVGKLDTIEIPHPVLIRMGTKESKKRQPYADLLEQTIEENHLGVSGSIHSIVAELLKFNPSKSEIKPLEGFAKSDDLKAGDIEIDSDNRHNAVNNLLNWAQLESCLLEASKTNFSRLAGGIRPLVYVFDDYSNFIQQSPECSHIHSPHRKYDTGENSIIARFYRRSSSSQSKTLDDAIDGFSSCLNNLSVVFDVRTQNMEFIPKVEAEKSEKFNYFKQVADILKFSELEENRNQIGAFIIDLEWLPSPNWIIDDSAPLKNWTNPPGKEQMGHYAVRLLTQRYPEIPCFIFTGMWSIETLQQSLAAGAAWCFQKPLTHHPGSGSHPSEELNYFNLEHHLTEFAKRTYGTYEQLPNPEQFDTSNQDIVRKLNDKAKLNLFEKNNNRANSFRRLIASQFTANRVKPIRVLTAGKSGALATFFVEPSNDKEKEATRFVKIDSWLDIQTEYFSYQHIIRPRLNNHVAHIIQKPSVTQTDSNSLEVVGAITSSLAGFPEDYNNLSTLQEIIDRQINEPGGIEIISKKICTTLEMVLLPLYQDRTKRKYWLEEEFSLRYVGDLISIGGITDNMISNANTIDCSARELTEENLTEIIDSLNNKLSKGAFRLRGWCLSRLFNDGEIILHHPVIKSQLKLKPKLDNLHRFNALWMKPGHYLDLVIALDSTESLFLSHQKTILEKSKLIFPNVDNLQKVIEEWKDSNYIYFQEKEDLTIFNPLETILNSKIPLTGYSGAIHGDLNLNNILYPEDENVGFLIDFAKTKKDGLIAYDFAFLEVHIWIRYLLPNILISFSPDNLADLSISQILFLSLELVNGNQRGIHSRFISSPSSRLHNALKIIASIRQLVKQKLPEITPEEQYYCLGASFLKYSKFPGLDNVAEISDKINVLSFLAAAYYLSKMPRT